MLVIISQPIPWVGRVGHYITAYSLGGTCWSLYHSLFPGWDVWTIISQPIPWVGRVDHYITAYSLGGTYRHVGHYITALGVAAPWMAIRVMGVSRVWDINQN